jgi:hypothetical protein
MNKEFAPYEPSLALKELGFDEPCFGYYGENQKLIWKSGYEPWINSERNLVDNHFAAGPTYSQAFRFFREKYNISYSIDWMSRSLEFYNGYYVHFRGINGNKINQENFIVLNDELPPKGYGVYKTYEEAELACLIKLIEIVKNK